MRAAFLASLVLLAGCSGHHGISISVGRDGPPFEEVFPLPAELVETDDVDDVRRRLSHSRLPDTQAHHDTLLALLDAQPTLSAEHLLLLVEAVHLPDSPSHVSVHDDGELLIYTARGEGRFAPVADALLLAGADKLSDLDARLAGRLMARTHDDATLARLAERWLPEVDDGSEQALVELARGFRGSPALEPFLFQHLAPSGRLDGEQGWALVEALPFDSGREQLVSVLAARHTTLEPGQLRRVVRAMSFDDGRSRVVGLLAPLLTGLGRDDLLAIVGELSFDSGRLATLRLLAPHLDALDGAGVGATLDLFSFDSGRADALEILCDSTSLSIDHAGAAALLRRPSFDNGRLDMLRQLEPRLVGPADPASAQALLGLFSFDSGRLDAMRVMAPHWAELPTATRLALVDQMSFQSGRRQATELLMR